MYSENCEDIAMSIKKNAYLRLNEQYGEQQQLIDLLVKYAPMEQTVSEIIKDLEKVNKVFSMHLETLAEEIGIEK